VDTEEVPPPPTFVTPVYDTPPIVAVPDVGELRKILPTSLANALKFALTFGPEGCEHEIPSCPPALKKYLAASPLEKVAVCVNSSPLSQVLPYAVSRELVDP